MGNKFFRKKKKAIVSHIHDSKFQNPSGYNEVDIRTIQTFTNENTEKAIEYYKNENNLTKALFVDEAVSLVGDIYFDKRVSLEDVISYQTQNDFNVNDGGVITDVSVLSRLALLTEQKQMPSEMSVGEAKRKVIDTMQVSKKQRSYPNFLSYKVDSLLEDSLFQDAQTLVETYSNDSNNLLGHIAFKTGDYERAISLLDEDNPEIIEAYLYSGNTYKALKMLNETDAISFLKKINLDLVTDEFLFYYKLLLKTSNDSSEVDRKRWFDLQLRLREYDNLNLSLLDDSKNLVLDEIKKVNPSELYKLLEIIPAGNDDLFRGFLSRFVSLEDDEGVLMTLNKLKNLGEDEKKQKAISMYHLGKPLEDIVNIALEAKSLPDEIKIALGDYEFENGNLENAVQFYGSLNEFTIESRIKLGLTQIYNGDFEQAYNNLKDVDLKDTAFKTRFAFLVDGYGLTENGIISPAEILRKVEGLFSNVEFSDKMFQIFGNLYLQNNELNQARDFFKRGYGIANDETMKMLNAKGLLDVLIRSEKYKKAKEFLFKLNNRDDNRILYLQSELELAMGEENVGEFVKRYEKLINSSERGGMSLLLVRAYLKQGNEAEAEQIFREFVNNQIPRNLYIDSLDLASHLLYQENLLESYINIGLNMDLQLEQNEALIPLVERLKGKSNLKQTLYEKLYEQAPDKYHEGYIRMKFEMGDFEGVLREITS